MNDIDLESRHAVVTGSAQGIGLAITRRLLASGASVALWDKDAALLASTHASLGKDAAVRTALVDVADAASVQAATDATISQWGRIDIIVPNAGIAGPNLTTWNEPVGQWQQVLDINLTGVFLCCRAIVPHMLNQNYGRIVNIACIAGKEGNANAPAYSASKAGVIALTKSLRKETAGRNVAVNCVTSAAACISLFDQLEQHHIDFMLSRIPRGHFPELNKISSIAAWLVSEENSFTTAGVFDLSGGRATY
jgi:NAD(P)-dependent dehydrogenase (short-subunit alcohol dehydrogenase family)